MILLQRELMRIICEWADSHDKPITLKELAGQKRETNPRTIRASAEVLCKKGYLRRGCEGSSATYVLTRRL
jgi:predicted transcriptional regulator of viral defense system